MESFDSPWNWDNFVVKTIILAKVRGSDPLGNDFIQLAMSEIWLRVGGILIPFDMIKLLVELFIVRRDWTEHEKVLKFGGSATYSSPIWWRKLHDRFKASTHETYEFAIHGFSNYWKMLEIKGSSHCSRYLKKFHKQHDINNLFVYGSISNYLARVVLFL